MLRRIVSWSVILALVGLFSSAAMSASGDYVSTSSLELPKLTSAATIHYQNSTQSSTAVSGRPWTFVKGLYR
jgi:hypothetical protein